MPESKVVRCSVCHEPIRTATGATLMTNAPVVCRRCFGESSYSSTSHWSYNPLIGGRSNGN